MASGKRSRQGGFSYIEVLVGIVILAIVALGVTQGFAGSSALIARSKAETLANNVAANQLERVRAMDLDLARRMIFSTGDVVNTDTREFLEKSGNSYLQKPFDTDAIRRIVRSVLVTSAR